MYAPISRRAFMGLAITSAYLITARPLEASAALVSLELTDQDKRLILDYVFTVIDGHFAKGLDTPAPVLSHRFSRNEFKMVWVAFLKDRKVIACKGKTIAAPVTEEKFLAALRDSTEASLKDKRFIGEIGKADVKDLELVIHLNETIIPLDKNDLTYLKEKIELGVHSFKLELHGRYAWYLENVPITSNLSLEKALTKLSKKAGLSPKAFRDPDATISISDMLTFKGKRTGTSRDLFRYDILVKDEDITKDLLMYRLGLVRDWFLNNVNPKTKRVEYLYRPVTDTYSNKTNETRHLATLYMMCELDNFLGDGSLATVITDTIDYYLTKVKDVGSYSFIDFGNDSKLSYTAFMILALINRTGYPRSLEIAQRLAEGILQQQREDGSFATTFNGRTIGVDYYPGEAMLALMRLYEVTKDERLIDSVSRGFPYYRAYWRETKATGFIPWHTQVYYLLASYRPDGEIESFIYEMNDWVIDTHQITRSPYPETIGGIKKENPNFSTSTHLEGFNDAYRTALLFRNRRHIRKYRESIRKGMRFVLQTQFTPESAFWVKNPKRAIGGFKESLIRTNQRNDFAQHGSSALLKAYRNDIFL